MNGHFAMDPESLQTFLANAYAVQESGLDKRSLAALIEIQHFLVGEEFDLRQTMQLIADHALRVSGASGVAVGLLKSHELVYLAGSGSAAKDIGYRVPAVLSASSQQDARREILRVEDAASDPRIEAEICRQFGAMSLLMLPIYSGHILAGVLQVLFDTPHPFREREVRVYRLMVGVLEEGMLRAARPVEMLVPDAAREIPLKPVDSPAYVQSGISSAQSLAMTAEVLEQATSNEHNELGGSRAGIFHSYVARLREEARSLWEVLSDTLQSGMNRPITPELRNAGAAIGIAVALSTVIWVAQVHRSSRPDIVLPSPAAVRDLQQQTEGIGAVSSTQKAAGDPGQESAGVYRGFKRVRVGPAEVDYISDDVTIRRFETRPPKTQVRSNAREVRFGDDVTLRYFVRPAVASQSPDTSEPSPKGETPTQLR